MVAGRATGMVDLRGYNRVLNALEPRSSGFSGDGRATNEVVTRCQGRWSGPFGSADLAEPTTHAGASRRPVSPAALFLPGPKQRLKLPPRDFLPPDNDRARARIACGNPVKTVLPGNIDLTGGASPRIEQIR